MDPHQKFSAIQLGSVDVAHYQEDAAQRRLAFVKSIADPDKEEQRLCRASSILDFQRIAVAEALSATPEARKALQKKYFEDLPKELQKQVEGYECRLKARDEILDPTTEQLVRLTKDNRTQYLATFQAEYYAKEVPSYPQVILDSSTADLLELKERLDILATEWRRSL